MLDVLPPDTVLVACLVSSLMVAIASREYYGQWHFVVLLLLYGRYGWLPAIFIQTVTTVISLLLHTVTLRGRK